MRVTQIHLPDSLEREIAREAEERGKSWSELAEEMLEESVRMRRIPGIAFADGPAGRRAVLAGTGLDVWEIVATWRASGEGVEALRRNYPWLTETQLQAALAYYTSYPGEIDSRLACEERWTPERVRRELPFSIPRSRSTS